MLKSKEEEPRRGDMPPVKGERARRVYSLLVISCFLLFAAGCRMDMQDQPRYEVYEPSTFFKDGLASRPLVEGTVARGYLRDDKQLYTGKRDTNQNSNQAGPTGGSTASSQNPDGRMAGDDRAGQEGQTAVQQTGREAEGANSPGNTTQNTASSRTGGAANQSGNQSAQGDPNDADTFPFPVTEQLVKRGRDRYQIFCAMCHGELGYGDGMVVRRGFRQPPSYHTDELRNARVGHFFDVITNGWGSMPSYNAQVPVYDRWAIIAYIRALQLSQQGVTAAHSQPGAQMPNTGGPK